MKKHFLVLALLVSIVSAVFVFLTLKLRYLPVLASTQGRTIDHLILVLFSIASVIMAVCLVTLVYSVVAFRRRRGDMEDGPSWSEHTAAETLWTLIPLAIVIYLSVYGGVSLKRMIRAPDTGEMEVRVLSQQFSWRFEYPEQKITTSELGLVVNRPVVFKLTSKDVIHSFWVPEFRTKEDAVPGMETMLRVTPVRVGSYKLLCAELCGIAHSYMVAPVRVMSREEFDKWVEQQRSR